MDPQLQPTKEVDEGAAAAIPPDVLQQLNTTRGSLGVWLPTQYPVHQLRHWRELWLHHTLVGCEVRREAESAAAAQAERERVERENKRLQMELQERFRLPAQSVVRIKAPQTQLDGRLGRLISCDWEGGGSVLMGRVLVDPVPPDHPLAQRDPRFRPIEYMPQMHLVRMEQVTREHPEALG